MADVMNRLTGEYLRRVHAQDYPHELWARNPNRAERALIRFVAWCGRMYVRVTGGH